METNVTDSTVDTSQLDQVLKVHESKFSELKKNAFEYGDRGMDIAESLRPLSKQIHVNTTDELVAIQSAAKTEEQQIRSELPTLNASLATKSQETLIEWNSQPRLIANLTNANSFINANEIRLKSTAYKLMQKAVILLLALEFCYGTYVGTEIFPNGDFFSFVSATIVGLVPTFVSIFCKWFPNRTESLSTFKFFRNAYTVLAGLSSLVLITTISMDRMSDSDMNLDQIFQFSLIFALIFITAAVDLWNNSEPQVTIDKKVQESKSLIALFEDTKSALGSIKQQVNSMNQRLHILSKFSPRLNQSIQLMQSRQRNASSDVLQEYLKGTNTHPENELKIVGRQKALIEINAG